MKRLIAGVFFLLALLGGVAAQAERHTPRVGEAAPDASLRLIDGSQVRLSDLRGQVVVLNFWATWCVPCRRELPLLDSYYRAQRSHGLKVFAVTTEDSVPVAQLHHLFDLMAITPVRYIGAPYRAMEGVPTNFVIGRDGSIRYAHAGAFDLDTLNAVLVPLLNEHAPATAPRAARR
jgi:peroxiredoxin